MSYLEVFRVFTGVGVDVSNFFGVGEGAGVLKCGAGPEPESEKCDSADLWSGIKESVSLQKRRAITRTGWAREIWRKNHCKKHCVAGDSYHRIKTQYSLER